MPTLTTLVNFNGINGDGTNGSLIADAAGDLFGTTGSRAQSLDCAVPRPQPETAQCAALIAPYLLARETVPRLIRICTEDHAGPKPCRPRHAANRPRPAAIEVSSDFFVEIQGL
jgi:hypothetical protein